MPGGLDPGDHAAHAAHVLHSAFMFVVVSILSGVLLAGLAVPIVGFAGMTGRSGVEELKTLPQELEVPTQAERTTILLADGSVLTHLYDRNRVYVPLDKIAPVMQQAQIAIEDHRFYDHGAMDPIGTLRAFIQNSAGNATQGASSLTQQYVKLVQVERAALSNDPRGVRKAQETSYARKIQELRYAMALEKRLTKDQILERYLNLAYYGNGAYGVEAAAELYFDTTAAKLTLSQAAMLAGLVQNPDQVNPIRAEAAATERRDVVLNRMAELNLISYEEAQDAKQKSFDAKKVHRLTQGCVPSRYPFLCDYVVRSLLEAPELGETRGQRQELLQRGGLTIQTKIDSDVQDAAQAALSRMVSPTDPVISTINIVEPGTGQIVAMAQSRPVMGDNAKAGETYYNYSVTPALGGAEGYQAGSTFKLFTLAAALDKGVRITQRFPAPRTMDFSRRTWQSCDGPFKLVDTWRVSNSTRSNAGGMSMAEATAWSVNTYFVQLEQRAGLCNTVTMAKNLGVELTTPGQSFDDLSYIPSFTLGAIEVSPLSLAEAYATVAARGIHCDAHIVASVDSRDGKTLVAPDGNCRRVMRKEVADGVTKLLRGVMNATGAPARIPGGYPQAGKTGTTEEGQAVWFAGFTPELAATAMIAVDKTSSTFRKDAKGHAKRKSLRGLLLKKGTYLAATGGGDAGAGLYRPAMTAALKGRPKTGFTEPPKVITKPKVVTIPSTRGLSLQEIRDKLGELGFLTRSATIYSSSPRGAFLGISPGPGRKVEEGTTVTLLFSAGPRPKPPPKPKPPPESKPPSKPPTTKPPSQPPTSKPPASKPPRGG